MFQINQTLLLVIDVQERLFPHMQGQEELQRNLGHLTAAAKLLKIPEVYTEQVPEKIGPTIAALSVPQGAHRLSKETFSCWAESAIQRQIKALVRKQIIVVGMEAHVCVYQTVVDLLKASYKVAVVTDAVSSRAQHNIDVALQEMRAVGARLTTTEMILMELVRSAGHERFKEVLALIK